MKVKATDMSVKLNVRIKELHRIAAPGEEFEVSPARFEVLSGQNRYKAIFVTAVKNDTKNIKEKEEPVKKKGGRKSKTVEETVIEENA